MLHHAYPHHHQQQSRQHHLTLTLQNLSVFVKGRDTPVLSGVSFRAESGRLTAVMGPSGGGKTTLLHSLCGRLPMESGGCLRLGGQQVSRKMQKAFGYVTQEDVFFPQLTLRQTLRFTAEVRLGARVPGEEKRRRIERVVAALELDRCIDTRIGDFLDKGLSGGEKRRASIACELLHDPQVLLLDEPTSGLDANLAHSIVRLLHEWATAHNRIVVTSIHQPSSHIYHVFDDILLLVDGQVCYRGQRKDMANYFDCIGVPFPKDWNPADYLMEVAAAAVKRAWILEKGREIFCDATLPTVPQSPTGLDAVGYGYDSIPMRESAASAASGDFFKGDYWHEPLMEGGSGAGASTASVAPTESQPLKATESVARGEQRQKPSWWAQFRALVVRNFQVSRLRSFAVFPLVQYAVFTLLVSALWFHIQRREEDIKDILGLLFYLTLSQSNINILEPLSSFTEDLAIVQHELLANKYKVSAYYLAKTLTEVPTQILLPLVSLSIIYWAAELGNAGTYMEFTGMVLLNVLACQGMGIFFSLVTRRAKANLAAAFTLIFLAFTAGGLFLTRFPPGLGWVRWLSFVRYAFQFHVYVVFSGIPRLECASSAPSRYPACAAVSNSTISGGDFISGWDVLANMQDPLAPPWLSVTVMLGLLVVFRVAAFLLLKRRHREQAGLRCVPRCFRS